MGWRAWARGFLLGNGASCRCPGEAAGGRDRGPGFGRLGGAALLLVVWSGGSAAAQEVRVDTSACRGMYEVLAAMRNGASREVVGDRLDSLLESPAYAAMFKHYNRPWRPDHLPKAVFKRMIMSLQFPGEYPTGENQRADQMREKWLGFYPDLERYQRQLRQVEDANLPALAREAVQYARTWLPAGWTIPDSYFPIMPHGGSPAFSIDGVQGYDFLQLDRGPDGAIDVSAMVGTVAHESHHLGLRSTAPDSLSPAETMAWQVVSLCIPEGVATAFISGPPDGCAPAARGVPFHLLGAAGREAWKARVDEEGAALEHQVALLARAVAGTLSPEELAADLREYWLTGVLGRAYVLGADMMAAVHVAFGREGVFEVMQDPRQLFAKYNAALDARPHELGRCPRVPVQAVRQALAIGGGTAAR